jgi:hypothetical protein
LRLFQRAAESNSPLSNTRRKIPPWTSLM